MNLTGSSGTQKKTIGMVALPEEMIASLNINDRFVTKMSCSPADQRQLAIGWLYSQGLIDSFSEIECLEIRDGTAKMCVWLKEEYSGRFKTLGSAISLSSGGGSFNTRLLSSMPPLFRSYDPDLNLVQRLARTMLDRAHMYKVHGGVHCAMLADIRRESVVVSFEDIGRNNAIDKVMGWGLERQVDFSPLLLFVTGRVSSDMILKCYRAGIATVVSLNTATSLAFDIATKTEQTLICHVLKQRPILVNY